DAAGACDARDLGVGDLVLGVGGEVLGAAAAERGGEDQLSGVVGAFEGDLTRVGGERLDFAGVGQDQRGRAGPLLVGVEGAGGRTEWRRRRGERRRPEGQASVGASCVYPPSKAGPRRRDVQAVPLLSSP